MSGDELEKKFREHAEAIRNLERIGGDTVSAIRSLHERLSKAQEYQLRDNRLSAESITEAIKESAVAHGIGHAEHAVKIKCLEEKATELDTELKMSKNNVWWLDRWVLALSAAFCSYFGWDYYKGMKP